MGVLCARPFYEVTAIPTSNRISTCRNQRDAVGSSHSATVPNMDGKSGEGEKGKSGLQAEEPSRGTADFSGAASSLSSSPLALLQRQQQQRPPVTIPAPRNEPVVRLPQSSMDKVTRQSPPHLNLCFGSTKVRESPQPLLGRVDNAGQSASVAAAMPCSTVTLRQNSMRNNNNNNNNDDDDDDDDDDDHVDGSSMNNRNNDKKRATNEDKNNESIAAQRGRELSCENAPWKLELESLLHPNNDDSVSTSDTSDGTVFHSFDTTCSEGYTPDGEKAKFGEAAGQRVPTEEGLVELIRNTFTSHLQRHMIPYALRALTLQTVTLKLPTSVISSQFIQGCYVDLKGEYPRNTELMDLNLLRRAAPTILKYRIAAHWEGRIAKALGAASGATKLKGTHEGPLATPFTSVIRDEIHLARVSVVSSMLRSSGYKDIFFGAFTPRGVPRRMLAGCPLFFKAACVPAKTCCSFGGDVQSDHGGSINGVAEVYSRMTTTTSTTTKEWTVSAASFEFMPSIFLVVGNAKRLAQHKGKNGRKVRRSEVHPMFTREFVATLASGCEGACTYATTMLPEFLAGLKSFPKQPEQAVLSAVRATMHRMFNVIAREMIRHEGFSCLQNRFSIRAPPIDVSVVYLREDTIFFASTPGMQGMLFLYTDTKQRVCAKLEGGGGGAGDECGGGSNSSSSSSFQFGADAAGALHSNLNKTSEDVSPRSDCPAPPRSGVKLLRRVYDLPSMRHGVISLSKLHKARMVMSAGDSAPETSETMDQLMVAKGLLHSSPLSQATASRCRNIGSLRQRHQRCHDNERWQGTRNESFPRLEEVLSNGVVLPHVVVVAVREFWCEMPLECTWELLRWMLLLEHDASWMTFHFQRASSDAAREVEVKTPHLAALRASSKICPRTRKRLENFYRRRVLHHISSDELKASTLQQEMDKAMQRIRLSYAAPNGSTQNAPTLEQLAADESLGDAIASFLSRAVEKRLSVWRARAQRTETRGPSCSVMVVVVPPPPLAAAAEA